jgi:hypothetical protein
MVIQLLNNFADADENKREELRKTVQQYTGTSLDQPS